MVVRKKKIEQISKPFNSHVLPAFCFAIGLTLGIMIYSNLTFFPKSLQLLLSVGPYTSPPRPPPLPQNYSSNIVLSEEQESLMHNMTDEELLFRATTIPNFSDVEYVPKVAFMWLAKNSLPFAPLWEKFFEGHEGLYSIYLHQHPDYVQKAPKNSVFYRRQIPSQPVLWGTMSMIDGERRLLANALFDQSNQRFILLSESCIPLFNFTTIYNYLIHSKQSFVGAFYDSTELCRGRYNPKMSPEINLTDWRKGAQWFELRRDLAVEIVSDTKYYEIFRKYCQKPCYNDEHYLPTLVNMRYGQLNANRSTTFVDWSTRGAHPRRFDGNDISEELLDGIRNGSDCIYNGKVTSMCFLFARKFHPNALKPLLRIAPSVLGSGS